MKSCDGNVVLFTINEIWNTTTDFIFISQPSDGQRNRIQTGNELDSAKQIILWNFLSSLLCSISKLTAQK